MSNATTAQNFSDPNEHALAMALLRIERAQIQTERNGYVSAIINGQRKGGFVSVEEAQAFVLNAR